MPGSVGDDLSLLGRFQLFSILVRCGVPSVLWPRLVAEVLGVNSFKNELMKFPSAIMAARDGKGESKYTWLVAFFCAPEAPTSLVGIVHRKKKRNNK